MSKRKNILSFENSEELSEREKTILRTLINLYIIKASPIGSRFLAKYLKGSMKLSPATIRNVMADLEELRYISHPHTSAGRVPTDKGYRFYVNSLNDLANFHFPEKDLLLKNISSDNAEQLLKDASKILSSLSKFLSVVEIPHIQDLKVHKIELISISKNRMLVVVALDSNIVRTVTLEAAFDIEYNYLEEISGIINERISGMPLSYLRENFNDVISDIPESDDPHLRLFVDSMDKIFEYQGIHDKILIAGTQNLLEYPEFEDINNVRTMIELIENEEIIIHQLGKSHLSEEEVKVLIGSEMENILLEDYSLILSPYKLGSATGAIGLIGPKRMDYSKMISLVKYVSDSISE